ncbi:MAG: AbrB/MazE/SpoVT family DNA-binding domain-containing protein [Candidatus Bathyarchaeia archaeon]
MARVEIDRYGRILIPREVRERLGLKPKTPLEVAVRGSEVVLRVKNADLDAEVKELATFMEREAPEPFVNEPSKGDSKWLSKEYCLRKLGL